MLQPEAFQGDMTDMSNWVSYTGERYGSEAGKGRTG